MRLPTYTPPYDVSSFTPPGVNIMTNMMIARLHGGPDLMTLAWFFMMVHNSGPWDYKQMGRQYANFGNFNYGAVGAAAGISDGVLLRAGGAVQIIAGTSDPVEFAKYHASDSYGDDPVDQTWIRAGIDYARRSGF